MYKGTYHFTSSIFQPLRFSGYWKQINESTVEFDITKEQFEELKMSKKLSVYDRLPETTLQKVERENPELVEEAFEKHKAEESIIANFAFSIVYEGKKKYSLVKIGFNPETNQLGGLEILRKGMDIYSAQNEFKAMVAKTIFKPGVDKIE